MKQFSGHKNFEDWCHICGKRNFNNVDVLYAKNAKHGTAHLHSKFSKYIRICKMCAYQILYLDEIESGYLNFIDSLYKGGRSHCPNMI